MTKVSDAKPSNEAQILVRIPRNKLGKLNNKWNTNNGRKGAKNRKKKTKKRNESTEVIEKKLVEPKNDGVPHLPILVLKLNKKKFTDSPSECEPSDESDSEDASSAKVTHYKKKIIKKHSVTVRERNSEISSEDENALCESTLTNENEEAEKDSETAETDSNNEQEAVRNSERIPTTTATNTKKINMPKESKPKIVVLENTMISGPSRHLSTLPTFIEINEANKNTIGKHVLPTVMVPQQKCSRVALPLNDLSLNNTGSSTSKLKEEELKLPNYPNVIVGSDPKNGQNINKATKINNLVTTSYTPSNIRRKKSVPVRRKSTVTDECKVSSSENTVVGVNPQSKLGNFSSKVYTRHNGLELLSMVCTTTAPSTPTNESNDMPKFETVTTSQEQLTQTLPNQRFPPAQHVQIAPEDKRNSQINHPVSATEMKTLIYPPPVNTKPTPAQKIDSSGNSNFDKMYYQAQMQMDNSIPSVRNPPPPYNYANFSTPPYLNVPRNPNSFRQPPPINVPVQMPQYNLNGLQQNIQNSTDSVLRKPRHVKGAANEQFPRTPQNAQPPSYYQPHQIISNQPMAKDHLQANRYRPNIQIQQEPLVKQQTQNQKVTNPNPMNQQIPPIKTSIENNMHANVPLMLQQHYHQQNPYLNQFVPPSFERQVPMPPNPYPSVEPKRNIQATHQKQNSYPPSEFFEVLNSRVPQQWQRQSSNPPVSTASSQTPSSDPKSPNDIDRNQMVTLYYESQDGEKKNESGEKTVIYTVPFVQNGSSLNTINSAQASQRIVDSKQLVTSKEVSNIDGLCMPLKINDSVARMDEGTSALGRIFIQCLPEQLANMIVDKIKDQNSKELDDIQKHDTPTSSIQQSLPSPQKQIQQSLPSPQKQIQQSLPSPQKQMQQSLPSPQKQIQQSSPSPQKQMQQSLPSPQKQIQQSLPSPQKHIQQSLPSPQKQIQQSLPSPQKQIQQSLPSPQKQVQQSLPSPQKQIQQSLPSPQIQQSAPSPQKQIQQSLPSLQKQIQQTVSSVIIQNLSVVKPSNNKVGNFSHRIENFINSSSSSETNTQESTNQSSETAINLTLSAAKHTAKKIDENTIFNQFRDKHWVRPNFGGSSVDKNKCDEKILNQAESIKNSVSVYNNNIKTAILVTSPDNTKKTEEAKIQEKVSVPQRLPFQSLATKPKIQETWFEKSKTSRNFENIKIFSCVSQNSESAINLTDPTKHTQENLVHKLIQKNNSVNRSIPYQYSQKPKTCNDLVNGNQYDVNILNRSENIRSLESLNKSPETAINLSTSSDDRRKREENRIQNIIQERTSNQNRITNSRIHDNIDKNKSHESSNSNHSFCVIVEAKSVDMNSKNKPLGNEVSTLENIDKEIEIIDKYTETFLTDKGNDKQDKNLEELNNKASPTSVSNNIKSNDNYKYSSSSSSSKKSDENDQNNKNGTKDNNTGCTSSKLEDQEEIKTVEIQDNISASDNTRELPNEEQNKCLDLDDSKSNVIDDVEIKKENLNETRDPNFFLNNHFLFDMEFEPNDQIENIFARIMPSCFMILNLIHEMQNMNNVNWWPVDTVGNLLKIKLSLRGISVFLRKSKKLAVHLDPYLHHMFLFLLECFRTFRERVRKIVDDGYSLKENYISTSEADIYRDVFIQLYDYLCCTRVTDYVNLTTRNTSVTVKKEICSENGSMARENSEFSNVRQKHQLIIEKIRQRKVAEEERNENFKNFILRLDHDLSEQLMPREEQEIDENSVDTSRNDQVQTLSIKHSTNDQKMNSMEENFNKSAGIDGNSQNKKLANHDGAERTPTYHNLKESMKRKIEFIVIDSDSDDDKQNSEDVRVPVKKLKPSRTNTPSHVSCIINLDDDDDVLEVNENNSKENKENNKRQLNFDYVGSKKLFSEDNLRLKQTSLPNNQKVQESNRFDAYQDKVSVVVINDSAKSNFEGTIKEIETHDNIDNKNDVSETIQNLKLKEEINNCQNNDDEMLSNKNQENTEKDKCLDVVEIPGIKEEIKCENEELFFDLNEGDNAECSINKQEKVPITQQTNTSSNPDALSKSPIHKSIIKYTSETSIHDIEDSSNSDSYETVEAIQKFLQEMESSNQSIVRENTDTNADKTIFSELCQNELISDKINSTTNIPTFTSTSHNIENKLVGIATPNVKDADISIKKINQPIAQTIKISENNHTSVLHNSVKVREEEIIAQERMKEKDPDDEEMLKDNIVNDKERTIIQKLISFRKPFKKMSSKMEDSIELPSEENSEMSEKSFQSYSEDVPTREHTPKEVNGYKDIEPQNNFREINNNLNSTPNKCIQSTTSGNVINQENWSMESLPRNNEKARMMQNNIEMRRYSSEGYHRPNLEERNIINENFRSKLQEGTPQSKVLKRSASQPHDYSTALKRGFLSNNVNRNYQMEVEKIALDRQANMAISEYFSAQELMSRHGPNLIRSDAIRRISADHKNMMPVGKTPVVTETSRPQQFQQPNSIRSENGKELLRQAIVKKHAGQNLQHTTSLPPIDHRKDRFQPKPISTRIPSLQSIYNESVETNGFISQYIKDQIGVLSKKESLGPVEYVEEIKTLLRLPLIPKDFKDFYIFVTKQQILQFHQPIAFHIFLELLNQSGLKDYHKKFTEYTKRKYEDKAKTKKDVQSHQPQSVRNLTR